jgi:DNA-binding NtrC family response regulator
LSAAETIPTPTRTLKVLIVEDEPRLRELLLDVIPDMGFTASAARSAEEAMKIMRADVHDVLLLDLQLPAMGGMNFFEQVREHWPATQVVILTAFGDLASARQAIRLEVVDFLSKPCPLREVEIALERARRRVHASERESIPPRQVGSQDKADVSDVTGSKMTLSELERRQILAALDRNHGNRTAAAAELGISRRTLHYRLSEYRRRGYGLNEPAGDPDKTEK